MTVVDVVFFSVISGYVGFLLGVRFMLNLIEEDSRIESERIK